MALTIEQIQAQTEYACNGDYVKCYYMLRNKATNTYMKPHMQALASMYLQASNKYKNANISHAQRKMHGMFTDMYRN